MSEPSRALRIAFAISIGAAIPCLAFGRGAFAAFFGLGVLALLASDLRAVAWRELTNAARTPLGGLVLVTLAAWSVSALGSDHALRSLEAVWRTGLFVAAAVMIHAGLRGAPDLFRLCLASMVAFAVIGTMFALLSSTVLPELYWSYRMRGWLHRPLQVEFKGYSAVILVLLPIFVLSLLDRRPLLIAGAVFSCLALAYVNWHTGNRAVVAGMLAAIFMTIVGWGLRKGSRRDILIGLAVLGGLTAFVLYYLVTTRYDAIAKAPKGDWLLPIWLVDFQRQTIWQEALSIAREHLVFGVGPNTINLLPAAQTPMPGNETLHVVPAHPHSWFFEILTETGIVGLGIYVVLVGALFYRMLRRYRWDGRPGMLAAIVIVTGYMGSGLFNFSYWSAWWQISVYAGMAVALARPGGGGRAT